MMLWKNNAGRFMDKLQQKGWVTNMKNQLKCAVIFLSSLLLLSGCSAQTSQTNDEKVQSSTVSQVQTESGSQAQTKSGKDLKADFSGVKQIDTKLLENSAFAEVTGSPMFAEDIETADDLKQKAEEIVQGQVEEVRYIVSSYGIPYTAVSLKVTDPIAGSLQKGDQISILHLGGYMTLADEVEAFDNAFRFENVPEKEWDSSIIEKRFSPDPIPQIGDTYVYCLVKNIEDEKDAWMGDTYCALNEQYGRYREGEDGMYTRTLGEDSGAQKLSNGNHMNRCEYDWLKAKLS